MVKNNKRPNPDSLLTIGLDVGYGAVKAVTADTALVFPSVCGHAREIKFQQDEIAERHPGDQIQDDEGRWFVGDLALIQLTPGELLRLRGRTANEDALGNVFRRRLMKVVIGKLMAGIHDELVVHVRIASGLPVDHMGDSDDLKAALLGQHLIKTDTAHLIANVSEVMVMPQPLGCLYSVILTPEGDVNRNHIYKRTGVVDVGTYTVDIALDDEGEFISADSGSVEGGVYMAHNHIAAILEKRYRQKMPFKMIDETLRTGTFRAHGELVDMSAEVEDALASLRSATLNLISEMWKSGTGVDVMLLCGGGAELVYESVKAAYPQTHLVRDAQLANARGYLNYARFKETHS
ncbi:MAG: ParM/StbA family protein [Bacteroidetes bacterium]|nr:MAG: ParM/StbA family protein [Bacteroidota bacterium]